MKLAIVKAGHFDGAGVSRVVESWARMLSGAGHEVTVIAQAAPAGTRLDLPGVTTRLVDPRAGAGRVSRLWREAAAIADSVAGLRRTSGLELILSHNSVLTVYLRRRLPDLPILQTIHSPAVDEHRLESWKYAPSLARRMTYPLTRALLSRFDRLAIAGATAVHTLSEYTWRLLRARYPAVCRAATWLCIPGTFDDRQFVPPQDREPLRAKLGLAPDETLLLTVRRLVPRNGLDRILSTARALSPLSGKRRFLIGGSGALERELRRRIEQERLGPTVELLGFVSEERLVELYQAADVFLLPTRELECFGLPVIEALGCGTPPLVMPHGGPAEVCRPFPERIAAANTDAAFTELVRRFLEGEIPRRIEGAAAWARERYSEAAVRPRVLAAVEHTAASLKN